MQGSQDIEMQEGSGSPGLSFSDPEEELKVEKAPPSKKPAEPTIQYFSTVKEATVPSQTKRPNSPAHIHKTPVGGVTPQKQSSIRMPFH